MNPKGGGTMKRTIALCALVFAAPLALAADIEAGKAKVGMVCAEIGRAHV